ncbi:MAG: hypothetical protein NTV63_02680 [Candidatus Woesearchaeota archaeon]|nr:hypothetical protein [Candidatus Woesearchaeota archaeon]
MNKMANWKKIKSKKGSGVGDILPFVFSILLYGVIVLFFILTMFSIRGCSKTESDEQLITKSRSSDINTFIINYARAPVSVDGRETEISELISLWAAEPKKYEQKLTEETLNLMKNSKIGCPRITIIWTHPAGNLMGTENLEIEGDCESVIKNIYAQDYVEKYTSRISIPIYYDVGGSATIEMSGSYLETAAKQ